MSDTLSEEIHTNGLDNRQGHSYIHDPPHPEFSGGYDLRPPDCPTAPDVDVDVENVLAQAIVPLCQLLKYDRQQYVINYTHLLSKPHGDFQFLLFALAKFGQVVSSRKVIGGGGGLPYRRRVVSLST